MQNEKMQINLAPGMEKAEVILREVNLVNELPVKPPVKVNISGTIGSIFEFLEKRKDQTDQIFQKRCHILVDRENIKMELITNENDFYLSGSVTAKLEKHPKFVDFGINNGYTWTPTELGMFIKMNRAFFADKNENMRLVSELMNFTATVNNAIKRAANEQGNLTDNFEQVVNSNLPKSFTVQMPIFKGRPAESIEVETFVKVDGRTISFILLSPGAQSTEEEIRDTVIDEQITKIREICPDIAIIEQ